MLKNKCRATERSLDLVEGRVSLLFPSRTEDVFPGTKGIRERKREKECTSHPAAAPKNEEQ